MLSNKEELGIVNPFYQHSTASKVLFPNCSIRRMQFWEGFFLQDLGVNGSAGDSEPIQDKDLDLHSHFAALMMKKDEKIAQLEKQIEIYEQILRTERERERERERLQQEADGEIRGDSISRKEENDSVIKRAVPMTERRWKMGEKN